MTATLFKPNEDYRSYPAISQSMVKVYSRSKMLYYQQFVSCTYRPEPTPNMQWGTDCELFFRLGPEEYMNTLMDGFEVLPKGIKMRRGKAYEAWRAELPPGTTVLTQKEADERKQNVAAFKFAYDQAKRNPRIEWILDNSRWHERIRWTCPFSGLERKAELDLVNDDHRIVTDLKTAADATPDGFIRQAFNLKYYVQAATYLEAKHELSDEPYEFNFVVVQNSPPHQVELFNITDEYTAAGDAWNERWMWRLKNSIEKNDWHESLSSKAPIALVPPRWAKYEDESLEAFLEETA